MVFISATRLRLKSLGYLPAFLQVNGASSKQLVNTPGLLYGAELIDKKLTFWIFTLWQDMDSIRIFVTLKRIKKLCKGYPSGAMKHRTFIGSRTKRK